MNEHQIVEMDLNRTIEKQRREISDLKYLLAQKKFEISNLKKSLRLASVWLGVVSVFSIISYFLTVG